MGVLRKPLFSFVLPSYNRKNILDGVLTKLEALAGALNGETIVVDNNSEDGSAEMILKKHPHVKLCCSKENIGARARNIGIEMSKGRFIFMLDDDSYPLPGSVERGIGILSSHKDVGCVAYRIMLPERRFWTNGVYTVFTGCGAIFPARVLKEIGGYPEDILYYAEEYDVSFRLWKHGYRVVNPENLFVFHEKPSGNKDFGSRMAQLILNNANIYSKYMPKNWAARHIEYENWRYDAISRKEGVYDGYRKGLELAVVKYMENMSSDRLRLSTKEARRALGLEQSEKRLKKFISKNRARSAVVCGAGKLMPEIIEMLRTNGLGVKSVLEDNKAMLGRTIDGVTVKSYGSARCEECGIFVCGSSSLAENDRIEKHIAFLMGKKSKVPFFRMCEYDEC